MKQEDALEILRTGANVFLTGEPGSGKTFVVNAFVDWLREKEIAFAVTASTGIAATHVGGSTIHSWSGMGIKTFLSAQDIDAIVSKEKIYNRVAGTTTLIIDEISMLGGKSLDALDSICRNIREDTEKPFGGIQVVLVGDFFQLPPVTRNSEDVIYAFQSTSWQTAKPLVCYLTEQHRQTADSQLQDLLQRIRTDSVTESDRAMLEQQTSIAYSNIEPTHLYTTNRDVDNENTQKLDALNSDSMVFAMKTHGRKEKVDSLIKHCLSPETLFLKKGAQVMFTKNNLSHGFVNGTLGVVEDFEDDKPVVRTADNAIVVVEPMLWETVEDGKITASVQQFPLRLAWAITVHKSQGMSLDAAEIDLSNAFVPGQGYVALSRLKTLDGMKVQGLNDIALKVDLTVLEKDKEFHQASEGIGQYSKDNWKSMKAKQKNFLEEHTGERRPAHSEDTCEKTKTLLLKKMSIEEIADERALTTGTIAGHLEQLAEDGRIAKKDVAHITIDKETYDIISKTIERVGDEFLKPIREALKEQYDYETIKLVRLLYRLDKQ